MNDENIVNLTGHLGQDPDIREKVATFRLAVAKRWFDRQANEWRDKTTWLTIATFGGNIAIAQAYLRKGVKVRLSCHLDVSKWDKGDGPKSKIEVIADEIAIIPKVEESRASTQQTPPPPQPPGNHQQSQAQEAEGYQAPPASNAAPAGGGAPAFGASGRRTPFGSRGGVFGKRNVFQRNPSPSPEPAQAPAPEPQPRAQQPQQPEPRPQAAPPSAPPAPPKAPPTGRATRSATGGYIRNSEPDLDKAPLGMHFGRGG